MSSARVALVTGAAQGIGKAIALRLNSDGFAIALSDLPAKRETLEEVAKLINSGGGRAAVFTGDVSVEEDVKNMVDGAAEALGGFHVASIDFPREYHSLCLLVTSIVEQIVANAGNLHSKVAIGGSVFIAIAPSLP